MTSIDNTLAERGKRYGEFPNHAEITQSLKEIMWATPNWKMLADDQKEALEMVAHKVGRILNGDPSYIDSWTDIGGYVRLVEKRLTDEQEAMKDWMFCTNKPDVAPQTESDDTFNDRLIDVLKKAFGDNVEVVRVHGQGA